MTDSELLPGRQSSGCKTYRKDWSELITTINEPYTFKIKRTSILKTISLSLLSGQSCYELFYEDTKIREMFGSYETVKDIVGLLNRVYQTAWADCSAQNAWKKLEFPTEEKL